MEANEMKCTVKEKIFRKIRPTDKKHRNMEPDEKKKSLICGLTGFHSFKHFWFK